LDIEIEVLEDSMCGVIGDIFSCRDKTIGMDSDRGWLVENGRYRIENGIWKRESINFE
jgi:hypothetical protein